MSAAFAAAAAEPAPVEPDTKASSDVWDSEFQVSVDGLRLRVAVRGEGEPLFLITGLGGSIPMWEPFARAPAFAGRQVIAFDPPGAGASQTPRRPRSLRSIAGLAAGVLDALDVDRADVLGVSLGGGIAQQLAHQTPDRVRQLVLCATSCGWGMFPGRPWAVSILSTPLRYYSDSYLKLVAPLLFGGEKWRDREFVEEHAAARLERPPNLAGYYVQMLAAMTWSSLPWLHTLPQRTLVLSGGDDPIVPPINGSLLAWRIPRARHRVIRGGGHLFVLDDADQIAAIVDDFLEEGGASLGEPGEGGEGRLHEQGTDRIGEPRKPGQTEVPAPDDDAGGAVNEDSRGRDS